MIGGKSSHKSLFFRVKYSKLKTSLCFVCPFLEAVRDSFYLLKVIDKGWNNITLNL